jgi:hypothetical protein
MGRSQRTTVGARASFSFSSAPAQAIPASHWWAKVSSSANQLAQVSQGAHPPGANVSVLQHLLVAQETVQEGMGSSSTGQTGCGRR